MTERQLKEIQLKQLQSLDLETKILKTKARIREFYNELGGKVYVSYSGGKDSCVMGHIVRQEFPDVPFVYCDTGLEYPELKEFVKRQDNVEIIKPDMNFADVIKEYGFPVISKEVAEMLHYAKNGSEWALLRFEGKDVNGEDSRFKSRYKKYKYIIDSPFKIHNKCCNIMKKTPFKKFEKETGLYPIIGTMTYESINRKDTWIKNGCNSFKSKRISSQPMSFWLEQDVLEYIKKYKLDYASVYGGLIENKNGLKFTGEQRTGCIFCMFGIMSDKTPNRFQRLKETHPQIYDYCINKLGLKEVLDYIGVKY